MTDTVHVFSDYACPWCYLGRARLKRATLGREVTIRVLHFPLSPDTPPEGRNLRDYLRARGYDVDAAMARMRGLLTEAGLPYHGEPDTMRAWPTRRAHELAAWAVEQPGGEAIHDALFHAYQAENRNIGDLDMLCEIAASVGLDPVAARAALTDGLGGATVDQHYGLAARAGVRSVPTFVAHQRGLVGCREVEELRAFLDMG